MVRSVIDAVFGNRLLPGERLIERQLAEASGAGRMAIRNGLLRLSNAGLVELSRNRGATVMRWSAQKATQIFEARIVVEAAMLRKLAGQIDVAVIAELEEIVEQEGAAYSENRIEEARHLSRHFHMVLCELADNPFIARFVEDLINCQPLLAAGRGGRPSQFCGTQAHNDIVDALERGDGQEAARRNTEHLQQLQIEMELDRRHQEEEAGGHAPEAEQEDVTATRQADVQ